MGKATATILIVLTSIVAWYLYALPSHYLRARKSGLPIQFSPANPNNPVWLLITIMLGYSGIKRLLPTFVFDRVKLTIPGWEFHSHHLMHERFGKSFILVTPGCATAYIGDPEIAYEMMTSKRGLGRIDVAAEILEVFGPNLLSVDGDEWRRQRKIVAPMLNERTMGSVWVESRTQARDMVNELAQPTLDGKPNEMNETFEGLRTITINVIGSAGFGNDRSWSRTDTADPPEGFKTTSMQAVITVVNNLFPTVFLSAKFLLLPFMPKALKKVGLAKTEFPLHLQESIAQERRSPSSRNSLINSLVRLADQDRGTAARTSKTATYLNEEEITGNLFVFTIAGFDTTANTLAYAIIMLAIRPSLQDWIIEEIDEATKANPEATYPATFSLLNRCLALMFETLRLYTPVPHVDRVVTPDVMTIKGFHFQPGTLLQVNSASIQCMPKYWGKDSLEFRPDRWIVEDEGKGTSLFEPARGTFMPWSTGPRYCPGTKMAQVEFVGVIYEIFAKWRVEAVQMKGESVEAARERLMGVVLDSSPKLAMQMNRPQDAVLRWVKR